MICAWIETSSAVVGSSAMIRLGLGAPAPARSPRAGACRRRTGAGSGRSAASARRDADLLAAARSPARAPRLRSSGRCVADRLDELAADRVQRIERGQRVLEDRADLAAADPAHRLVRADCRCAGRRAGSRPPAMRPGGSSRPMIAAPVSDLPAPDSPTTPSTSPGAIANEMSSTATSVPRRVGKLDAQVRCTSSSGSGIAIGSPQLRVQRIAQPVAEQVDRQHHDHQRRAGKDRDPPLARRTGSRCRRGSACRATAASAARRRRGTTASPR